MNPQFLSRSVLSEIADTLTRGETVKISSFGSFSVRQKGQRIGRNPKTGQEVPILPRKVLVFRASNVLKSMINSGTGDNSVDGAALPTDGSDSVHRSQTALERPVTSFGTGSPFNQPGN